MSKQTWSVLGTSDPDDATYETAQKAEQRELHHCEGLEADFPPSDTGKGTGTSGRRKDLTRSGDLRFAPDQPLRGP
ncbi:uncharacterized protein N7446_003988 [Penicillium canescens]|uniref:Uncharacterized protein n=1 Tax=Penicillium canescens TaxID=5083 RepID=A0AAD6N3Z0_PENCN|nr:uncharacterized protein N7446_003988 [Penicillium canescens]KAJ6027418.1 hypothetical protein N7460_012235 [Penicillium canescens]KAJ6066951.1 hypothetical protein N7446_003988 [Penicillium canescens]